MMSNKWIMTGFAVVLLIYSGWRTYDYMAASLQGVSETTSMLVALTFLFASEIGLLLWLHSARPRATTGAQEAIATTMVLFNFVGAMILGLADVLMHNRLYVVDVSYLDPVLLFAPVVLIAGNVGAYLGYTMTDSEDQMAAAERQLEHEETMSEIDARMEALKTLKRNRKALAEKLAPSYVKDITDRVTGRTAQRFIRQANRQNGPEQPSIINYNAEAGNSPQLRSNRRDRE